MSGGKIFLACFTVVFIQLLHISDAKQNHHCDPSSCGNIRNISYPFRLKDDPKDCGDSRYELFCENNLTVLDLYSQKYYVRAINYNNFTIRLVDASLQEDNCFVPQHSLTRYNFGPGDPYDPYKYRWGKSEKFPTITKPIAFISCPYPVNSPLYLDTAPCINELYTSNTSFSSFRSYSYVNLGGLNASDVRELCSIDLMVVTSWPVKDENNVSFPDIRSGLEYGFELSWFKVRCENCKERGYCYLDDANDFHCRDGYCFILSYPFLHCGKK